MRLRHDSERVVGGITLSAIVLGASRCARVGYHLDRANWGKGFMSEALPAVIEYAFEKLLLHRLEANYLPENSRSARVLERTGFVREGYAKKYLFINGAYRDLVLTSLTNPRLSNPTSLCHESWEQCRARLSKTALGLPSIVETSSGRGPVY